VEIQFSCLPISSSELRPLFCFEGATDSVAGLWASAAPVPLYLCPLRIAERARASRNRNNLFFQATKSQRWMPWRLEPMKDVGDCEKPREAVDRALIRGCPNGETRHPSWGVTPA
jgi:hypothetical protein